MKKDLLSSPIVSTVIGKQLSFPTLNVEPPTISPICLAYIAGIVDADGSICVVFGKSADNRPRFRANIAVSMTNPDPPMLCHKIFGGSFSVIESPVPGHKIAYRWTMTGQKARPVLLRILPYLTVKKHQVENALDYLEAHYHYNQERLHRRDTTKRYYTKSARYDMIAYSIRSRELNRRNFQCIA